MKTAMPGVLLCVIIFAQCVTGGTEYAGEIPVTGNSETRIIAETVIEESIPEMVIRVSLGVGVDPKLALALLGEENKRYDVRADHYNESSGSHDLGLFQVNDRYIHTDFVPRYWKFDMPFDVFDAESNTFIALSHLKYLLERFDNNVLDAVRAYNGGAAAVASNNVKQMTIDYSHRVTQTLGCGGGTE